MPNVLIVRGHQVTPWELQPWRELPPRFQVSYLLTGSNQFTAPEGLQTVRVRSLRDILPGGTLGEIGTKVVGDRYLAGDEAFARADIVHAEELSYWFAADAAKRKARHGFKLVQTIWETLPMMAGYRNRQARRYRELVLAETDLFLPATERAALALQLEGVSPERMMVCPPGIDTTRFAAGLPDTPPTEHTIISPGRLVWEKGHHDVLRALALLHRGIVTTPDGRPVKPRLSIVGSGPEEHRLHEHARELGLADFVQIGSVSYEQMPGVFAGASAMVLASQSSASASYHPLGIPHAFWEEQFGYVFAEAMAAGLAIVTTTNGAIPEVVGAAGADLVVVPSGEPAIAGANRVVPSDQPAIAGADLVAPGDWPAIARALAAGPLRRSPGERVTYSPALLEHYSTNAAAARLADAYDLLDEI